jgi:hypothetical protein
LVEKAMTNEFLEFTRIVIYLFTALMILYMGVIVRPASMAFIAIATQFLVRSGLLIVQIKYPIEYREINNWASTPMVFLVGVFVFINLWKIRKL